jgi:hypothetical protein
MPVAASTTTARRESFTSGFCAFECVDRSDAGGIVYGLDLAQYRRAFESGVTALGDFLELSLAS